MQNLYEITVSIIRSNEFNDERKIKCLKTIKKFYPKHPYLG